MSQQKTNPIIVRATRGRLCAATSRPRGARRGFTLLEMVVAIAAVLIVAVGLAAIFDSIGETVATGRRVSRVNQTAKLLEQTLRRDFERMTRDGFLVIRQQYADADGDGQYNPQLDEAPVSEAQARDEWSVRRVDEIMFFASGDFATSRSALAVPGWKARASEAMVYYGHGQPRRKGSTEWEQPALNDTNDVLGAGNDLRLGRVFPDPEDNPNQFASRWILVRHATLLSPLSTTPRDAEAGAFGLARTNVLMVDKECQVRGQPASAAIFRAVNRALGPGLVGNSPPYFDRDDHLWHATLRPNMRPNGSGVPLSPVLASGLVDIATTSLAEVRSYVLGFADTSASAPVAALLPSDFAFGAGTGAPVPGRDFSWSDPSQRRANSRPGALQSLDYMQSWMDNALPTRNVAAGVFLPQQALEGTGSNLDPSTGVRMRCEPEAPSLFTLLSTQTLGNDDLTRQTTALLNDASMLQANNLLPGCSQFKVDWSFGQSDTNGNLLWYGPPEPDTVGFYSATTTSAGSVALRLELETRKADLDNNGDASDDNPQYEVSEQLVYGYDPASLAAQPLSVTSFFGYIDPLYTADIAGAGSSATPNGSTLDNGDFARSQLAWTWPQLIRVRATIADPADPKFETTFEFVFRAPDGGAGASGFVVTP